MYHNTGQSSAKFIPFQIKDRGGPGEDPHRAAAIPAPEEAAGMLQSGAGAPCGPIRGSFFGAAAFVR